MLGFLDTFDAVAFPTFAMMILFGVCLFVEKNALVLDEEDEDVVAFVLLLAHPYPVRKVVAKVDAEFCACAENMVDDDDDVTR